MDMNDSNFLSDQKMRSTFRAENTTIATDIEGGFLGQPCSLTLNLVFWVLNALLAVVILTGNTFACVVFLKARHFRRTYMTVYLISLAISDICMALLVIPFYAVFCSGCSYSLTEHCWIIRAGKGVTFGANVFNLLAISFDRHEAVFNPLCYSATTTTKRVTFIVLAIWGLPILLTAARNIWQHKPSMDALYIDRVYTIVLTFLFVFIPLVLLLIMNCRILYIIKMQSQQIEAVCTTNMRSSVCSKQASVRNTRRLKGTLACVVVVLVYIVCWLPRVFFNFCVLFRRPDLISPTLVQLSLFFLFLQSSLNPFIYSFYREDFKQAAFQLIRCRDPSASISLSQLSS